MVDWNAIKTEYITQNTSYRRLGEKYGVSYKRIGERGKKEDWVGKKNAWRAQTVAKALEQASRDEADRLAGLRGTAENLSAILKKVSQDVGGFYEKDMFSARTMRDTVTALKELTAIVRNLYDLPASGEQEAQALARERLALEKEKMALERAKADAPSPQGESEGGVIEIAAVMEEDEG